MDSASLAVGDANPAEAPPPRTHLLGLPAELLNYIVTLAVVEDLGFGSLTAGVQRKQFDHKNMILASPASPPLARTCALLKALVTPIYYGQNEFSFYSPDEAVAWLSLKLGRKDEAAVRNIEVNIRGLPVLVSLEDNTNEVAVFIPKWSDSYLCVRQEDAWFRSLRTRASSWAKEINDGKLYARKPSDKIADLCLYLSLHCADQNPKECGLSCVEEGMRLW